MKVTRSLVVAVSTLLACPAVWAQGSQISPGTFEGKKFQTQVSHEEIAAASPWKMGEGEPPVGPGKALALAKQVFAKEHPAFPKATVSQISLVQNQKGGCYYRVVFVQETESDAVKAEGGRVTPAQLTYYVLLNSAVVSPKAKD